MHRFQWAPPLTRAFAATHNEKYARAFVEITSDWIAKNPVDKPPPPPRSDKDLTGLAWLDIQTGMRASALCSAFPTMVHGEAFTPQFLATLLASLYDHQTVSMQIAAPKIWNKAITEQRGLADVAAAFPEFKEARHWAQTALARARDSLFAQTTDDGVQREWCGTYHLVVLEAVVDIMRAARALGITIPDDYRARIRKMYEYVFDMATPDLGMPMFGDSIHRPPTSPDRTHWELYNFLRGASSLLGDPKYAALAKLDYAQLPKQTSYAFTDAGMYALRDSWQPDQIYLALHCSPPAISRHDHPDNGTFELYAFGRRLMPDTGFYTYTTTSPWHEWFRQTCVHQTLTLSDLNARVAGKQLLWYTTPQCDVVTVENRSYFTLAHRRTIWFVNKTFFVMLDEAIGLTRGSVDLHFQVAPGTTELNLHRHWARTKFDDSNVLIWEPARAPVEMEQEQGWYSPDFRIRQPRTAFRYRLTTATPAYFVTLVVPYRGDKPPRVEADRPRDFTPGDNRVELRVKAFGKAWKIGRDLHTQKAWCTPDMKHGLFGG